VEGFPVGKGFGMNAQIIQIVPKKEKTWVKASQNMVLHRPTGIYYVRKYRAGKGELFKSTGETRKGRAQTLADEMQAQWLGGKRLGGRRYPIGELCDLLEDRLSEDPERRRKTRQHDKTYLPIIRDLFGEEWADEIDEAFWDAWVRRTGRGMNRTLGDVAKYLSKVLTFAFEQKIINRKPRIKNPDAAPKSPPVYTIEQIQGFLEHADSELKDLLIVATECGIRPHENRELRWDWIEDCKIVRFPETFTKTKKAREIVLSPGVQKLLTHRLARRQGPFVFSAPKNPHQPLSECQLSRMWRRMLGRAGISTEDRKGPKFHWVRHTFGSIQLLEAGQPLPKVALYMGNSPKVLFDRYMAKDAQRSAEVSQVINLTRGKVVKSSKKGKEIKE
jgi:integrase